MKKHIEIITITTNDIAVTVKIDYDEMKMSLVEKKGCKYETKNWMFAGRGLDYAGGWHKILEAMKTAMKTGFDMLNEENNEREKNKIDFAINVCDKDNLLKGKSWSDPIG